MTLRHKGAAVTTTTAVSRKATNTRKFEDDGVSLTVSPWVAARVVGIGRDPFYDLIREGRVKVLRIGSRIRVPRVELEEFIKREAK
jgi:excisionase family DNA binding protein